MIVSIGIYHSINCLKVVLLSFKILASLVGDGIVLALIWEQLTGVLARVPWVFCLTRLFQSGLELGVDKDLSFRVDVVLVVFRKFSSC